MPTQQTPTQIGINWLLNIDNILGRADNCGCTLFEFFLQGWALEQTRWRPRARFQISRRRKGTVGGKTEWDGTVETHAKRPDQPGDYKLQVGPRINQSFRKSPGFWFDLDSKSMRHSLQRLSFQTTNVQVTAQKSKKGWSRTVESAHLDEKQKASKTLLNLINPRTKQRTFWTKINIQQGWEPGAKCKKNLKNFYEVNIKFLKINFYF